jgi:hypothetical protein
MTWWHLLLGAGAVVVVFFLSITLPSVVRYFKMSKM